jgi:hypothetical protein
VRLVALVRQRPDLTLVPPAALKLNLDGNRDSGVGIRRDFGSVTAGRAIPKSQIPNPKKAPPPSWWVARAKEGEVKPGFTKAEMTRTRPDDPRVPGGVFERVGALLSDLIDQG